MYSCNYCGRKVKSGDRDKACGGCGARDWRSGWEGFIGHYRGKPITAGLKPDDFYVPSYLPELAGSIRPSYRAKMEAMSELNNPGTALLPGHYDREVHGDPWIPFSPRY
jgi:hypothetical protein